MDRQQIEKLHRQASEHHVRGEHRDAIEAWKRILDLDPMDSRALECLRLTGAIDEAPSGGATAPEEDLHRRLKEIDARLDAGDFHGAMRTAETLRSERPTDPEVLAALTRACLAGGDSDQAAEACGKLLSLDPAYAEAARLLEECRRVSPPESRLGVLVLRGPESEADAFDASDDPISMRGEGPDEPLNLSLLEKDPDEPLEIPEGLDDEDLAADFLGPPDAAGGKGPASSNAATAILRQRVNDLMSEARTAAAAGRGQEALGLLTRLLILDDQNREAMALVERLRREVGEVARNVDVWLAEGIRHMEQGRIEEARQRFLQILERSPDHKEALDYLEKTDTELAAREERGRTRDLGAGDPDPDGGSEPMRGRVWHPPERGGRPSASGRAPEQEGAEAATRGLQAGEDVWDASAALGVDEARPSRRISRRMVLRAAVMVAVVGFALAAWSFFTNRAPSPQGRSERSSSVGASSPHPAVAPPAAVGPASGTHEKPPLAPGDRERKLAEAMARGSAAFDAGSYEAAVIAYNDALALEPSNQEARSRLLQAGEMYRKSKEQAEKLSKARRHFSAGEYESALGLFYRVPEGEVDASVLNRYKANGWYNLGVVALRAADCTLALDHFDEALALLPTDGGVRRAKALAEGCRGERKDRAYYDMVERLPFRDLEDRD